MEPRKHRRRIRAFVVLGSMAALGLAALTPFATGMVGGGKGGGQTRLPTTGQDFFMPGTQPNDDSYEFTPVQGSVSCIFCHGDYSLEHGPADTWAASVMAQSARDPVWHAALAIANQDAEGAGAFCIRCHAPAAWLGERGLNGTTDDFILEDFDGVACHFCHRMVNPVLGPDSAIAYPSHPEPAPDTSIIGALAKEGLLPLGPGNGQYIMDPRDVRRGPYDDVPLNMHGYSQWMEEVFLIHSPFHQKSDLCGTCHDVSNPVFSLQKDGTYGITPMDEAHPTLDPAHMFPEQRTYSEWANSEFATTGVVFEDGRFGGAYDGPIRTCQDCHMPDQVGGGCFSADYPPFFHRPDLAQHSLAGANHWVVSAIAHQLGPKESYFVGLYPERVEAAKARTIQMLRDASDLELSMDGSQLRARVINQTGHKLPTGYPEGRRMWLNVKFFDDKDTLIEERGAYDYEEALLLDEETKIYEVRQGFDESVAKVVGLPAGKNFHLALANVKILDNRIPPRGFTNAAFEAVGAAPVDYSYEDGQYWDDTLYAIPPGATTAVVSLLHEVSTREYMEFLRDENTTNDAGQTAYDLWEQFGKARLVTMDSAQIKIPAACGPADLNCDGVVDGNDLAIVLGNWGPCGVGPCLADINDDAFVDGVDLAIVLGQWG